MPNGMYGGVRGERKSPLLDFVPLVIWKQLPVDNARNMRYYNTNL